jgi:hypothetical protein
MSSLAGREAFRTGTPLSRPSVSRFELWFWIALVVLAAVTIAGAIAASSYTDYAPPETFFVGP